MKINKLLIIGFGSILLTSVASAKNGAKKTFEERDVNGDGKVSEIEFTVGAKDEAKAEARFEKKDKDADGVLSKEEFAKCKGKGRKGPKKPRKHRKPRKDQPEEE